MNTIKSREALAVKYRPQTLAEVVGQTALVNTLLGHIKNNTLPRSILITGATGCGKTTVARILAHYINCENFDSKTKLPCFECSYCRAVAKKQYPDVEELNFSDDRGIDAVRQLIASAEYASNHNARIFILDEIQSATKAAQNALLKILEEPPEGVFLILLTTDPHKLLPTVKNRCLTLHVERVEESLLATHLLSILEKEAKAQLFSNDTFTICKSIAKYANGYVRLALSYLDRVIAAVEGGTASAELVNPDSLAALIGDLSDSLRYEPDFAKFLISGIYSAKYAEAFAQGLNLLKVQSISLKYMIEKAFDYHIQTMFIFVDPQEKYNELYDPFYVTWKASLIDWARHPSSPLKLTYQAAADITKLFLELSSELGTYAHDERKLLLSYIIRMVDAVKNYQEYAYTPQSPFHKRFNLLKEGL